MHKKLTRVISIILSVMLVMSMCLMSTVSVAALDGDYTVAGDFLTPQWDPSKNPMVDNGDGTYSFTETNVPAGSYGFKVTDGTWTNSWGKNGGNYTFTLAKTADVTINFNAATQEITVESDGISTFKLDYIVAVGNGDGNWLNGANWDLSDATNRMTEVEPGIWEITYEDVEAYDNYNVKFACNGSWQPYNWNMDGILDGQDHRSLVVEEDGSTVTLGIDVNGFDFANGTGTVSTYFNAVAPVVETTAPATEPETTLPASPDQPVTTEPVTEEPTTVEPTTVPETTVENTTEESTPTTPPSTPLPGNIYSVAGDFLTPAWDPSSNFMEVGQYEFNDAVYGYALTVDVEPGTWNFKVTNGTWDVAYPAQNFSFTVTDFGSVTVYFNDATHEIAVDGEYIDNSEFVVETITAVGNGDGTWLNGANWDPADASNDMTEVAPGVWEITYTEMDAYDSYEVKFAVNHSWTYNWTIDGIFDGQTNIGQVVEEDGSTVTLRIDINGFDFKTKEGSVVTEWIVTPPVTEPATTEPVTEEPTTLPGSPDEPVTTEPVTDEPTTEPVTDEPTTVAPAGKFTVAGDFVTPNWDPSANEMTAGEYEFDGVAYDYALTVDAEAGTWNFKVTNGTWDVCYPAQNFSFTVTDFGSVTIYFNSETHEIAVDGEYIDNSEFVVEVITAVGNGDGTWLNGVNWDPADASNDMTEVAPGVWEITYENMDAYDSYEVKFAVNHSWTYNWTIDGIFDGQTNIGQVVEEDGSAVTLRIDINGFDFKTKEGSVVTEWIVTPPVTEPVTTEPVTEEPTTLPASPDQPVTTEPVTEEPTTVEPTTVEPTTVEPTTVEPTTEEPTTVPADKFTAAGDFLLPSWDPSANEMTKGEYEFDGVAYDYALTVDAEAGTWNFKVTNGTWDVAYPAQNFSFTVTDFGSVTIYFNSETHEIAVDGEYIDNSEFVVEVITAVGNGDGTWLNGANWDPADASNDMTEVAPGVWEITYENMDAYDSYEVKFAVNHSWTYNWTIDGIFDGQTNIGQVVEEDGSTVTLRIDINGFDFKTKEGTVVTAFEVTPPTEPAVLGDIDGDGEISIKDATKIQEHVSGYTTLVDQAAVNADVDNSGDINIKDATYVQMHVGKFIDNFDNL